MLRVSKVPPGDPTTEDYVGQNRFQCLTCPYQFVINKRYYERKYMKKKEVEDILGGKGAWDNVDKTHGTSKRKYFPSSHLGGEETLLRFYPRSYCGHGDKLLRLQKISG